MKQEDKELLLKDISARLPYGVKIQVYYEEMAGSGYFDETVWTVDNDEPFHVNDRWIENIKPYLLPMSSITEEQRKELRKIMDFVEATFMNACCKGGFTLSFTNLTDWLNANHFDYRGLIPKGLAIDATGLGVYENNA